MEYFQTKAKDFKNRKWKRIQKQYYRKEIKLEITYKKNISKVVIWEIKIKQRVGQISPIRLMNNSK